jgi:rod shape-determining protein MreC
VAFGGALSGELELRFLSGGSDLRPGDALVTSGLDGVFPTGIPVGTVSRVEPGEHSASSSRVMVWPAAALDDSRMMLILLVDRSALPPLPQAEPAPDARRRRSGG